MKLVLDFYTDNRGNKFLGISHPDSLLQESSYRLNRMTKDEIVDILYEHFACRMVRFDCYEKA